MKTGNNATLAAGALFVIAASIFVGTMEPEPLPVGISNSLELRPALFLARVLPLAGQVDAGPDMFTQTTTDLLARVAGKPLASKADRLAGAAASAAAGARHLVPLFVGNLAETDAGARAMLRWAFDPGFSPGPAELNALRLMPVEPEYGELAVTTLMAGSGRTLPETAFREKRRSLLEIASLLLVVAVPALIVWGSVWWFRWRRLQLVEIMRERAPIDVRSLRGLLEVYVWFMVLYLSVNLILPGLLEHTDLSDAGRILVTYLLMAAGGIAVAVHFGKEGPEQEYRAVLGFTTRPGIRSPARPAASLGGGIRGYAMLWPVVLIAAMISDIFGAGGSGLQDPLEQYLAWGASDVDRLLLILSAVILAPMFEEILFRGFFYRRLRAVLTPYGAASVSGFIFAAAHFSTAGFLQVWAIGFTLCLAYEQTGRLRSSMIAHGLWNLGTILSVILLYG